MVYVRRNIKTALDSPYSYSVNKYMLKNYDQAIKTKGRHALMLYPFNISINLDFLMFLTTKEVRC